MAIKLNVTLPTEPQPVPLPAPTPQPITGPAPAPKRSAPKSTLGFGLSQQYREMLKPTVTRTDLPYTNPATTLIHSKGSYIFGLTFLTPKQYADYKAKQSPAPTVNASPGSDNRDVNSFLSGPSTAPWQDMGGGSLPSDLTTASVVPAGINQNLLYIGAAILIYFLFFRGKR